MGQSTSKVSPSDSAVVPIPGHGSIRGVLLTDRHSSRPKTQQFTGIPYAQPPTGPLRWRRPQPLAETFQFDQHGRTYEQLGNVCPQPLNYFAQPGGLALPAPAATYNKSEDCLQLNIWVPVDSYGDRRAPPKGRTGLAVLFFIHGGWLQIGNPHLDVQKDPSDLIDQAGLNCIVVTPGYRLNVFGFFAHDALRKEDPDGLTGNYGFWDQRMALEWVYNNIRHFGGDPDNIAVGGLSAGAHSAHSQLLHEFDLCQKDAAYKPIIKRLFFQSNAVAWPSKQVDEVADQLQELCQALEIPSDLTSEERVERLRQVPDSALAAVVPDLHMHTFRAVRDDRPNAFVRPSWTRSMADGSFGRWCEQHSITLLMGETQKEERVYAIVNSPHDQESFVRQLTNYYPRELVLGMMSLYGLATPDEAAKDSLADSARDAPEHGQQAEAAEDEGDDGDLYSIFGVTRSASKAEIRAAYLALVRQHHPDKAQQSDSALLSPDASADALIRQLNTAYALLSDDTTRQAYDRALEAQISQAQAAKQAGGKDQVRIADTLDLDSFQALRVSSDDSDDEDEQVTFTHPCRCGHDYQISEAQISQGVELVACDGCSEVVRVIWTDGDEANPAARAKGSGTTASAPSTPEGWSRLFGEVAADSQVYLTERCLVQDLLKGGFAPHAILRYRCQFRAPVIDKHTPEDFGVSHGFDDPVWWYALCSGGWQQTQLDRIQEWLKPYCRFVEGPVEGDEEAWRVRISELWYGMPSGVASDQNRDARWLRILNEDATVSVVKDDERWEQKAALLEGMRKLRDEMVRS